eukprot:scaffold318_cov396-Prasinococcus_capsulatus_cf.AAC.15
MSLHAAAPVFARVVVAPCVNSSQGCCTLGWAPSLSKQRAKQRSVNTVASRLITGITRSKPAPGTGIGTRRVPRYGIVCACAHLQTCSQLPEEGRRVSGHAHESRTRGPGPGLRECREAGRATPCVEAATSPPPAPSSAVPRSCARALASMLKAGGERKPSPGVGIARATARACP